MIDLNQYQKLGHQFKKRRLLANLQAALFSRRAQKSRQNFRPKTCLFVRTDHIGDYVLFRNLLPTIRQSDRFKDYRITLCGNIVFKEIAENLDAQFVDDFIWFDWSRFTKRKIDFVRFLSALYQRGFEMTVNPIYSRDIYADLLVYAANSKIRIGVNGDLSNQSQEQRDITDQYYTDLIDVDEAPTFEFYRNCEIAEKIMGAPVELARPQWPKRQRNILVRTSNYAVLVPGISSEFKRWLHFDRIAEYIAEKHKLTIVLVGKGKNDRTWIRKIVNHANFAYINLCDQLSLIDVADLLSGAQLVLGNDSGLIHVAALLGVPTVCVTPGTHAIRFNCYPSAIGANVHFVFPPALERLKGTPEFTHYSAQYDSGYDVRTIAVEDVIQQIEDVLSHAS
jgi:ADP-heptose:LPS heptosyltransferase